MIERLKALIKYCFIVYCILCFDQLNAQDFLGTKTPYYPQQKKYNKAPKGYKPVFINYVGRHGSRFMTSAGSDVLVINVLQQAEDQHALTKDGAIILSLLMHLDSIQKDNYGSITLLGKQEQHDIAARMQHNFPEVFQNRKLIIEMTEKQRTQQSAYAFLSGLKNYDSSQIEATIFHSTTDSILRFYDLSLAYNSYLKSDAVTKHIDSLQQDINTKKISEDVCINIFTTAFIDQVNAEKIKAASLKNISIITTVNFAEALYDVYSILFSAKSEMHIDNNDITNAFKNVFLEDDLLWFDKLNSAEDFYEKGPAADSLGIQITIATPLLRDLVITTDSCIQSKNVDGIFRFTHAEAISPLATLMGITQASHTSNSVYSFYNKWKAEKIIPLSANIQWIIYSNNTDYLIKVLLNEKEVALPVATLTFPFYKWQDVKSYFDRIVY